MVVNKKDAALALFTIDIMFPDADDLPGVENNADKQLLWHSCKL